MNGLSSENGSQRRNRILVTGAAGMLGTSLWQTSSEFAADFLYTDIRTHDSFDVRHLDVRDLDAFREVSRDFSPTHLFHFAAETSLERCEENVDLAWSTNALGAQNAALVAASLDIPLIYISTAGVFDGTKQEPYTEFDQPRPIMTYGASKLEGEIQSARWFKSYIVRAGWMVGGLDREHKFVSLIANQLASGSKTIYAVDDKFGTPTYAPHFARHLMWLIGTQWYGTYHLVCRGGGSRFDVAKHLVKTLGYEGRVAVEPVPSAHFAHEYFALRPRSEMMINYVLDLRGCNKMVPWQEALNEYLSNEYFASVQSPKQRAPL